MTRPVGPADPPAIERNGPSRRVAIVVALIPIWTIVGLSQFGSPFLEPVYANPPAILGLPAGVLLLALAIFWTAAGAWIVATTSSTTVRGVALQVFPIPATVVVLLAPALILVVQNL